MSKGNGFWDSVGTGIRRTDRPVMAQEPSGMESMQLDERLKDMSRRAWAESDGTFWGTPSSHGHLPTGLYRMSNHPSLGALFLKQKNDTDELIELPDSESDAIIQEVRVFKGLREKFKDHGFLYKRGILLWGPPGSGKTCTLQLVIKMLVENHNSIAVLVEEPKLAAFCLQALRRIEPDRQIVAILEDLDALCDQHGESSYLALLDGESQVDNIVYVATTNYPERLDKRFVDRPSRFDTVRYIGMPTAEARKTYLAAKLPDHDVSEYVAHSDGFSIAHLRELIILTQCFGVPLAEAAKRLEGMRAKVSSDQPPDKQSFGFS